MRKLHVIFFLILAPTFSWSQNYIQGIITSSNEETLLITDVKISVKHKVYRSDEKGKFKIPLKNYSKNDTIFFEHSGYEKMHKVLNYSKIEKARKRNKNINLFIQLSPPSLLEFKFIAKKVDTVYGSEKYSVEDFIILEDESMLLLAYQKTLNKGSEIVLTDANQKEIDNYFVPNTASHLFQDYSGKNYIICEGHVYEINIVKDEIRLWEVSLEDFYGFYHRVIDTIGENYYYSNYNEVYPAVKFLVTERNDTNHHELYEVTDDFMMELYRAQYKYVSGRDKLWAFRKEQETGIDKEIWIGAASFSHDILYQPVYAPLFVIDDSVLVFDQYESLLYKFDQFHNITDSIPIDYFKNYNKEKWEQPLFKDRHTDKVYALYDKSGYNYLKTVNCQNGKVSPSFKLTNRFVEKVKIINGYVYYIYRPYESLQKKFIYKERLVFK